MPGNENEIMKKIISILCLAVLLFSLGGCRMIRIEEESKKPLSYTVMEESQLPEELKELINEKKEAEFQIAYQKGAELYLAKGYGRQMSGGYSVQVKEFSESSNAMFFETKLLGPTEKVQGGEPSYPYIVVKTEYRDGPVQFQ